ncbi:MAG TPA: hypothetical protein VGD48_22775 [Kutzneria sp.]|jgi:hypothetical protein
MRSNVLRAAVAGAGVIAALATGPLASAAIDNALTGSPQVSSVALAATATANCEPGGPTAADNALAGQLAPHLNGPRLGPSIVGYQVSCARAIVDTVQGRGLNSRAAVIAVTTAITESNLRNLTQAVDLDSLGLYQQRPSMGWGTAAQIENPVFATNSFLTHMLALKGGWQTGDIGQICDNVQISGNPSAYAPEVHDAQMLVDALWGGSSSGPQPLQVLAATSNGGLFHTIRNTDGTWAGGFGDVEAQTGQLDIVAADAARTGGDTQIVAATRDGRLFHTARLSNGSWLPWGDVLAQTNAAFKVADVGVAPVNNELNVVVSDTDGNVWHAIRHVDETWTSFGNIKIEAGDYIGKAVKVSAAAVKSPNGPISDLHVAVANDTGKIWHTARKTEDGGWLPFGDVEVQAGPLAPVADIAIAGTGVDLQMVAVTTDGKIWHTGRKSDGTWLPFGDVIAATGTPLTAASKIDAAGEPNGDLHVVIGTADGKVWHTARKTDGTWLGIGDVESQTSNPGPVVNLTAA